MIAAGLDRRRYEPLVVLPDEGPLADDVRAMGLPVEIHPLAVLRRELMHPRGLSGIVAAAAGDARILRRLRPALIHSNTSVILGGAAAARLAGVPHVWHVREIYAGFGRAWPAYRRLLGTAAARPCVSRATAAQFPDRARTQVIYDGLGVDPHRAQRDAARRALGLPGEPPAVGVLGRITEWKGQSLLARALASPALRARGVIGIIAGDAWPGAEHRRDALLREAERLGVRDRLHLVGFRDDIDNVYGAAELIAVPSTQPDPLPNAALEAAAAGCAVVAAAHGGLPELIHDRDTGRLFTPGDVDGLASCCAELLDDPVERERLGAAAERDVRSRFSARRLVSELQDLYDEVLESDPIRS